MKSKRAKRKKRREAAKKNSTKESSPKEMTVNSIPSSKPDTKKEVSMDEQLMNEENSKEYPEGVEISPSEDSSGEIPANPNVEEIQGIFQEIQKTEEEMEVTREEGVHLQEESFLPEEEESLSCEKVESSVNSEESLLERNPIAKEQLTRTERFQETLRGSLFDIIGDRLVKKKLTRDVAYKLFKECFDTMVDFVRVDEENRLPLAGIGTFSINMSPPRKPVRGGESKLSKYEKIPHLKWKPSDRYRKYLNKKILGYEED